MAKLVPLDESYAPLCLNYLSLGLSLGPRLLERVEAFDRLSVWLPDTCTDPPSVDVIPHGIPGHSERFGLREELTVFFNEFFTQRDGALVVSETLTRAGDRWPVPQKKMIRWFLCEPPPDSKEMWRDRICVYLTKVDADAASYDTLLRHAKAYPSVIFLTSLVPPAEINSGERLDPTSKRWNDLFDRAEYILIGVCDEMSYIVMSRSEPLEA